MERHALKGEVGSLDRFRRLVGGEQTVSLQDGVVRESLPILQLPEDFHSSADAGQCLFEITEIGAQRAVDREEPGLQARISRALSQIAPRLFDRRGRTREIRREPAAVRGGHHGFSPEVILEGPRIVGLRKEIRDH
ncbi:MAG TPA: hypothetical protein VH988_31520 [Thermoanaerobaculia bacterium]|nr:hypothetical protein [Thermoanaerobaculia bacterium]